MSSTQSGTSSMSLGELLSERKWSEIAVGLDRSPWAPASGGKGASVCLLIVGVH